MDAKAAASQIAECFSLADQVVLRAPKRLAANERLMIVVSDFYGSYWLKPEQRLREKGTFNGSPKDASAIDESSDEREIIYPDMKDSAAVLKDVIQWFDEPY